MKKITKKLILLLLIFTKNNGSTLVYSLKIRRLFSLNASAIKSDKSKFVVTAVPIISKRKRDIITESLNICEKNLIGGSIFNFRYVSKDYWWVEATTGVEKETAKVNGTLNFKNSRIGLDDIILSGGYNFLLNEKSQLVFYGLAGFPSTRKITQLDIENTPVGTRFFSLGLGSEISYGFINSLEQSLIGIAQARFIHFFERKWTPILPEDAKIQPGNVTDVLLTLQYRKKKNIFETGYNATFFTNQAVVINSQKIEANSNLRNSGYLTYSRLFKETPLLKLPGLIGAGISISHSDKFNMRMRTFWLNFSVLF